MPRGRGRKTASVRTPYDRPVNTRTRGEAQNSQVATSAEANANQTTTASTSRLDMTNPLNWTTTELRNKLREIGISAPRSFSAAAMRQLYNENMMNKDGHVTPGAVPVDLGGSETVSSASESHVSPNDSNGVNSDILTTVKLVAQSCSALQQTVNTLLLKKTDTEETNPLRLVVERANSSYANAVSDHTTTGMTGSQLGINTSSTHTGYNTPGTSFQIGVSAKEVGHIDLVHPDIRKKILRGEDINLCTLLIPPYEFSPTTDKDNHKVDKRLSRSLSISEFVTAFSKFKRIMCSPTAYPWRQQEFDSYLAHIIDIHNVWPSKFYEYHKLFSAKCAIALKQNHSLINWGLGDDELLKRVVAGAEVRKCDRCSSTTYFTAMCQKNIDEGKDTSRNKTSSNKDKYDRKIVYHEGQAVCNNFNYNKCSIAHCRRAHICLNCWSFEHGKIKCHDAQDKSKKKQ